MGLAGVGQLAKTQVVEQVIGQPDLFATALELAAQLARCSFSVLLQKNWFVIERPLRPGSSCSGNAKPSRSN
jgi:hypothetical protein